MYDSIKKNMEVDQQQLSWREAYMCAPVLVTMILALPVANQLRQAAEEQLETDKSLQDKTFWTLSIANLVLVVTMVAYACKSGYRTVAWGLAIASPFILLMLEVGAVTENIAAGSAMYAAGEHQKADPRYHAGRGGDLHIRQVPPSVADKPGTNGIQCKKIGVHQH